jgi:uncharacterized membrane protein YdcZ (DUF606 family)
MLRNVGAIVAGLIAGFVAMLLIAFIGGMMFPSSASVDGFNAEQVMAAFPGLPLGAKLSIILSWFGAALTGAAVAKAIAGRSWAAWTVGAVFVVYVLLTILVLPMPGWLQAVAVLAPLAGALIGNHLVRERAIVVAPSAPAADA